MNEIKAIIMDIDGTLLNSQKKITGKTKQALLKAQAKGIKLILASGRPTTGLTELGRELEMDRHQGLFVSYNGSKVVNCENMETLFNEPLSIEAGKAVLEHLKQFDVYPMIDKGNYMYVNDVYAAPITWRGNQINIIEYESRGGSYLLCEKKDLADFLDYEVNKILTAGDPEYLQKNYQAMMAPFADTLSCMFTADFYFEYTARGIDKAKALDSVLKPLGYSQKELIGFGDGMNDISLLRYTGTGVAMANAVQDLKEVAGHVTTSNDEDGIAKALYEFLPGL